MKHALTLLSALALSTTPAMAAPTGEEEITFTARSGESTSAYRGTLSVPENRADPQSRQITLSYVRFPATTPEPGPPIVYLAGGPGGSGSGTARGPRYPLFMEMRRHADVIAFDQRGTGDSTALPECVSSVIESPTEPVSDAEYAEAHRRAALECAEFWRAEGVDIAGYTTAESVRDLSALRQHLGAETIDLWGISYGTHLALAALAAIPDEVGRAILASAEGLDQTVKLPARTDAYFARLQAAVDAQPAARALYPDIAGMMRRVHRKLEEEPLLLDIEPAQGEPFSFLLQRPHMQQLTSSLIADPGRTSMALALYASLDRGDTEPMKALLATIDPVEPIDFDAMPLAMDVASGVSPARLEVFERQAPDGLVGRYLNAPMPQLAGLFPELDLGEQFRTGPFGNTPVLLLTGTLDGRTYPEGQSEAAPG